MKCQKCGKIIKHTKGLKFNNYKLDGWKCNCGEVYFNPEQVQKILLLNKPTESKPITMPLLYSFATDSAFNRAK